jgi:iron complex outermembrane receptor protein
MSSSLHKGNDKGWSWKLNSQYMGDKEAPITCLTQGIEKLTSFLYKFTGKTGCFCLLQLLQHYN